MAGDTSGFKDFREGDEPPDVIVGGFQIYAGAPHAREMLQEAAPTSLAGVEDVIAKYERLANATLGITASDFRPGETLEKLLDRRKHETENPTSAIPTSSLPGSERAALQRGVNAMFGPASQNNDRLNEAFTSWVGNVYPQAKNVGEVLLIMDGVTVEPVKHEEAWPPKGARLVSDIEMEALAVYEWEPEEWSISN